MATVAFESVTKVFGDGTRAVDGLDLDIADGELMVVVGPSGCGKTTALRMTAGLEEISDGSVRIGDRIVNHLTPKDRDIAMVFQSYALYPHLTVRDNIAFPLKLAKQAKDEIRRRVEDAAGILDLEPDETAATAAGFLRRAVAFYRRYGIEVERVLTDDGSCYRGVVHALACRLLGIKHLRTRPYRPQTNGKAERFIRTLLKGWAYGPIYGSSHERTRALDGWLWHYNHRRRHSALSHQPPVSRTNLLGSYT
jgi:ABC-type uncharacterized transport system YnjBCD ATPase subunit